MRLLALAGLLLGCRPRVLYPDVASATPTEPVVQIRRADVLHPIGDHTYFVAFDPALGTWHRTELFARIRDGRRVQRDRYLPDASFEHSPHFRRARIVRELRGAKAERLLEVLDTSLEGYPRQDRYVLTGPNSNSYASWVLRRARVGHDLHCRSVGRASPAGVGLSDSRTGVRVHTPVLGLEVGLLDGVEVHVGPGTWGLDLFPPAIKTPFGRLGFPQPSIPVGPRPRDRKAEYEALAAQIREELASPLQAIAAKRGKRAAERYLRYHVLRRLRGFDGPPPSVLERFPEAAEALD